MDQHRRATRKHLAIYPRVLDGESGEAMGRIADLSPHGLMVLSDAPIEPGLTFSLVIELPEPIEGRSTIEIEARSLWTRAAQNPQLRENGFELTRLSDQEGRMISRLVLSLGLTD